MGLQFPQRHSLKQFTFLLQMRSLRHRASHSINLWSGLFRDEPLMDLAARYPSHSSVYIQQHPILTLNTKQHNKLAEAQFLETLKEKMCLNITGIHMYMQSDSFNKEIYVIFSYSIFYLNIHVILYMYFTFIHIMNKFLLNFEGLYFTPWNVYTCI